MRKDPDPDPSIGSAPTGGRDPDPAYESALSDSDAPFTTLESYAWSEPLNGQRELNRLVRDHGPCLLRLGLRILANVQDAEDALQGTFLRAFRHLDEVVRFARSDQERWLVKVMKNCVFDVLRKRRRSRLVANEDALDTAEVFESSPSAEVSYDAKAIRAFVATLSPEKCQVWYLRHDLGLSLPEIAEVVGAPLGTVTSRLRAANDAIRAKFRESDFHGVKDDSGKQGQSS